MTLIYSIYICICVCIYEGSGINCWKDESKINRNQEVQSVVLRNQKDFREEIFELILKE